ncbi:Hsp33 family molecular chaperone HslO [Irregularibacter muris]|uniref:33 kDa chaperonin n=1 Tax=Irregularibacter muris TaxID=1796619 RepID=A0AAE3KZV2_9FIRM|nr:Hsp33 family molecular chaperone HslO [Irregularibacter muris]MCR1899775.1 Hsp33 family molecular chaperone HslO [Irregularibacter muris]
MKDYLVRAITTDAPLRAFAATTKYMVEEAQNTHQLSPLTSAALGRVLTAATMMGEMLKNEESKLTLQVKGDGPMGSILATGNGRGKVKGYVDNPAVELPLNREGKLDVGGAVGQGTLTVIMDLGLKEPYVGKVALINGEIAEDLTHYFATSEQTPSAVSLGVLVDRDRSIKAAGGFIIQVLPNCPDEVIETLESNLAQLPSITELLSQGKSPEDILQMALQGFTVAFSAQRPLEYICDCNRERLEKVLISLGEKELRDMIEEDGQAELQCHFCKNKYHFSKGELEDLLDSAK